MKLFLRFRSPGPLIGSITHLRGISITAGILFISFQSMIENYGQIKSGNLPKVSRDSGAINVNQVDGEVERIVCRK